MTREQWTTIRNTCAYLGAIDVVAVLAFITQQVVAHRDVGAFYSDKAIGVSVYVPLYNQSNSLRLRFHSPSEVGPNEQLVLRLPSGNEPTKLVLTNTGEISCNEKATDVSPIDLTLKDIDDVYPPLTISTVGPYKLVSVPENPRLNSDVDIYCFPKKYLPNRESIDSRSIRFVNLALSDQTIHALGLEQLQPINTLLIAFPDSSDDSADFIIEGGKPNPDAPLDAERELGLGYGLTATWRQQSASNNRDVLILLLGAFYAIIASLALEIWKLWTVADEPEH